VVGLRVLRISVVVELCCSGVVELSLLSKVNYVGVGLWVFGDSDETLCVGGTSDVVDPSLVSKGIAVDVDEVLGILEVSECVDERSVVTVLECTCSVVYPDVVGSEVSLVSGSTGTV
jgi:hypothetical protein